MTLKRIQFIAMITVLLMSFGGIASDGFPGSPLAGMTVYADDTEKTPVKVLILPKFEIGEAEAVKSLIFRILPRPLSFISMKTTEWAYWLQAPEKQRQACR